MLRNEPDPDVVRWGLQDLAVCSLTHQGVCNSVTRYETDSSTVGYVREVHHEQTYNNVENDLVIAQAYQEELSRLAKAEASGFSISNQASVVEQKWAAPGKSSSSEHGDRQKEARNPGNCKKGKDSPLMKAEGLSFSLKIQEDNRSGMKEKSYGDDDLLYTLEISEDSSGLDGEVGKRLDRMVPVRHVPKINGDLPSEDEEVSDHQRLLNRLQLYGLIENKVSGDGNCQFRSLSDQLYRSADYHSSVREQVVHQLESHPQMYQGYVPMAYNDYLKKMSKSGEWGDHVTLQAAADWFGVRIFMLTSFKDTCYIEILPHTQKSNRVICLSFWAEVHYNSIYPEGELPEPDSKKKKKWWSLGTS